MYDLVIKNGLLVDGTGAARRFADVAVTNGTITAVGGDIGNARREIDAEGMLVTPGFVDIHTHYDGQAMWDAYLTPSAWHGVTTAVFGNCGVGFAPVRPDSTDYLINLMEGVEDIPGNVLEAGVPFNWESFPEYLDALESQSRAIDIGTQVPHAPLRFYVMGRRGADHAELPTDDEITRMADLVEEALRAGALGFTTSRTTKHKAKDGRFTPSLSATAAELNGIALGMKRAKAGVLEVNSDFGPGEFDLVSRAAELAKRPLSCLLVQVSNEPDLWRSTLQRIHSASAAGVEANAQVGCRPIGMLMGLETSLHPFIHHPVWCDISALAPAQRVERMKREGSLRRRLIEEIPTDKETQWIASILERTFELDDTLDYEPEPESSLAMRARRQGSNPWALALDWLLTDDGKGLLLHPFENYFDGDLEVVRQMLTDEYSVMGVADGGAHVGLICDASAPTFLLSHWARDRNRGPKLPLEFLVRKHTRDTAQSYGLNDRGVLAPGYKADINVIDFDRLRLLKPEVVYDLPAGGRRLMQRAQGYRHTFVAGTEILKDDQFTGELPGRLIRGAQAR